MTFRQDLVSVRSSIYALGQCCGTFTPKNEMHDSANIDKDPQFKSISRQKNSKATYVSRDIRNAAMELVKILEFKIADTNDVCNGNKPCRRE